MEEKRTKLQIGCMIAMGGVFVLFLVLYLVMSFRVECRINGEVFAVKPVSYTHLTLPTKA